MANTRTVIPAGNINSKVVAWSRLRDKPIECCSAIDAENTRRLEQNPDTDRQDLLNSEEIGSAITKTHERVAYWMAQRKRLGDTTEKIVGNPATAKQSEESLDHPDLDAMPVRANSASRDRANSGSSYWDNSDSFSGSIVRDMLGPLIDTSFDDD
jgi:hypothetical protein